MLKTIETLLKNMFYTICSPSLHPLTDIHSIHIKDNFYIAGNIKHLLDLFNLGLLDYPYIVF